MVVDKSTFPQVPFKAHNINLRAVDLTNMEEEQLYVSF